LPSFQEATELFQELHANPIEKSSGIKVDGAKRHLPPVAAELLPDNLSIAMEGNLLQNCIEPYEAYCSLTFWVKGVTPCCRGRSVLASQCFPQLYYQGHSVVNESVRNDRLRQHRGIHSLGFSKARTPRNGGNRVLIRGDELMITALPFACTRWIQIPDRDQLFAWRRLQAFKEFLRIVCGCLAEAGAVKEKGFNIKKTSKRNLHMTWYIECETYGGYVP